MNVRHVLALAVAASGLSLVGCEEQPAPAPKTTPPANTAPTTPPPAPGNAPAPTAG